MPINQTRFRSLMKQHEKAIIVDALQQHDGHQIKAALWLDIHPESLRRKIVEHGLRDR